MKILVINAGSSSLKIQLIDMDGEKTLAKYSAERIGIEGSAFSYVNYMSKRIDESVYIENHVTAVKKALALLVDSEYGVIGNINEISAVGHRASHGGEKFSECVLIDDRVLDALKENFDLAPLHNPANYKGVVACREVMPDIPMTIMFDTAFHRTMPEEAFLCAVPYEWYEKYFVRNYGFHGISHQYVSQRARELIGNDMSKRMIICHLGSGSSITAVRDGKSIDNCMGFTPLSGIPMGTRSGDIDPTVLPYMAKKTSTDCNSILELLNKKSGLLGLSGISSDLRDIMAAWKKGDRRAEITVKILVYRIKKYIGAYIAALEGLDCIVFTGGIGERSPEIRELVCSGFGFLGIKIDRERNYNMNNEFPNERLISSDEASVKVLIVPTNEELLIARETEKLLKKAL